MKLKFAQQSLYRQLDDALLIEKISSAEQRLELVTPSLSVGVALALIHAYDRLNGNMKLITDISSEVFSSGINNLAAVNLLQNYAVRKGVNSFLCEPGIRIGSLIADNEVISFVPNAILQNAFDYKFLNASFLSDNLNNSARPIGLFSIADIPLDAAELKQNQQDSHEQMAHMIQELQQETNRLKQQVEVLQKAKERLPIQQNLKFIELEITGCRLTEQKLRIPPEFITKDQLVNRRLKSKYSIFQNSSTQNWLSSSEKVISAIKELAFCIEQLRRKYTFNLEHWKKVILEIHRKDFEADCNNIRRLAEQIKMDIKIELPKIMSSQLNDLFATLKPNILMAYKEVNLWSSEVDEGTLNKFFMDAMRKEFNRVIDYFNPQIKTIYKEISSEDAVNPDFRSAVAQALKNMDVSKLFTEVIYDETQVKG